MPPFPLLVCSPRTGTATALLAALSLAGCADDGELKPAGARTRDDSPALAAGIRTACGGCHPLPPPDAHPRSDWREEVERGYEFLRAGPAHPPPPPVEKVVAWYEDRASVMLPPPPVRRATTPVPLLLRRDDTPLRTAATRRTTNVVVAPLSDPTRPELVVCDGGPPGTRGQGGVYAMRPFDAEPRWRALAELPTPVHAEVVDLDGDGRRDLLVACLGSLNPTDELLGRVVWLRARADGSFEPVVLLEGAPRICDVRAGRLLRPDRIDLVVAAFGYRDTGSVLLLANESDEPAKPRFAVRALDARHGTIHVPLVDVDRDGRLDVVALVSQEHEVVELHRNRGDGTFERRTLYAAPHPSWGSSGLEPCDMDGDGDPDVLVTNGDALNPPYVRKPYHGLRWLENPGAPTAAWPVHEIGAMPGVHRALPFDSRGDGRPDVVAVGFLPVRHFSDREAADVVSVAWFERLPDGSFVRHDLETGTCDHVTCAIGDVTGDGAPDLVVGNMPTAPERPVTVWRNLGRPR